MMTKAYRPLFTSLLMIALLSISVTLLHQQGYGISYQVSSSMPKGWYLILPATHLQRNSIVVFKPKPRVEKFLQAHHWLPDDGVMMKHLAAVPGDTICKLQHNLYINHHWFAHVYTTTPSHIKLLNLPFCQTLRAQQYLPMSTRVWDSYDGRYFGAISASQIQGVAMKL